MSQTNYKHLYEVTRRVLERYQDEILPAYKKEIEQLRGERSEWISVQDRLPEEWRDKSGELVNYMVFMPEYGVDIGNYLEPAKKWVCMGLPAKVTHWMPLPEAPKEGA